MPKPNWNFKLFDASIIDTFLINFESVDRFLYFRVIQPPAESGPKQNRTKRLIMEETKRIGKYKEREKNQYDNDDDDDDNDDDDDDDDDNDDERSQKQNCASIGFYPFSMHAFLIIPIESIKIEKQRNDDQDDEYTTIDLFVE
ncbi:hypothetical protein V1477_013425 [Vespula maculifrons]|uniref:Uncharacterized protein n=1 Tax=Vespula maculifrons TaxID=7453 RepID=A0ABD2BR20_VESMC